MSSNAKLPQHERPGWWTDTVVPKPCVTFVCKDSDQHWYETFQSHQWWTAAEEGDKYLSQCPAQYREWQYEPDTERFWARTPTVSKGKEEKQKQWYYSYTFAAVAKLCARCQGSIPIWVLDLLDTPEQRVELAMKNALLRRMFSGVQVRLRETIS
jgi:hypothetical protein